MNTPKLYRASANVNSKRALDSKPSATVREAMESLAQKVEKLAATGYSVASLRMVIGRRDSETSREYGIDRAGNAEARQMVEEFFPGLRVTLSDSGIS